MKKIYLVCATLLIFVSTFSYADVVKTITLKNETRDWNTFERVQLKGEVIMVTPDCKPVYYADYSRCEKTPFALDTNPNTVLSIEFHLPAADTPFNMVFLVSQPECTPFFPSTSGDFSHVTNFKFVGKGDFHHTCIDSARILRVEKSL